MVEQNLDKDILIVGTGYVGLVTALGLTKLGHRVTCNDVNAQRIAQLKKGVASFYEPQIEELLAESMAAKKLSFSTSLKDAYHGQRYIFVGVQTPQNAQGKSDLSALRAAVTTVAETATESALLIIKSTVPVGIFDELKKLPAVRKNGAITFVSCPEFLAEGTAVRDFFNPTRTIVGADNQTLAKEVAGLFYGLGGKFVLTDAKTAQMVKYSANSFLATRVAFINNIAEICEKLNIDVHDVADALVMDPRVGGNYLSPSIGFGGSCLPKDLAALIESSEAVGAPTLLLKGVSSHNAAHLTHVIDALISKVTKGQVVTVFGLSFKPNTDDVRNSFALRIISALLLRGVEVRATDPHAIPAAQREISHESLHFFKDALTAAKGSDLQVFLTPWEEYKQLDLKKIAGVVRKKNIYDGMHVLDKSAAKSAGFTYSGIGAVDGRTPRFAVSENPSLRKNIIA
jgi:UDPglucose 6-dehydrogenase